MEQYIEKLQFMTPHLGTLADAHFIKFCLDMILTSTFATVCLWLAWYTGVIQTVRECAVLPDINQWACKVVIFTALLVFGTCFSVAFIMNISKFIVCLHLFLTDKIAYLLNLYM